MKPILFLELACAALLMGATVPVSSTETRAGTFQTWLAFKKVPLTFSADGLSVHVEALPCPAQPIGDSTCRWEGYNNQAAVTVSAPGMAPFRTETDPQAESIRVAVVRFDRSDDRPGLVVDNQYGGSGGILTVFALVPDRDGYRRVDLQRATWLEGEIADNPTDLSGDGRVDFVLEDGRFDGVFGCNACTPRPPVVLTVQDGRSVDLSYDPSVRPVFERHLAQVRPVCLSSQADRNGACAAYVADAARLGRLHQAWAEMLAHHDHRQSDWLDRCRAPSVANTCPIGYGPPFRSFPEALKAFLRRSGYLT